ncbi:ABC transporter permease [Methylomonas sp. MED-D]|uniref:ABC transporter permease n=1 Tax=unclassified Methylomonas TaxID=2608980 RepID=UPI0028A4616B|nr:ABC transporter permease [Methylomonas sp. MV1]MDT4328979.1 ABC transporter permease [Methylomonas sp. MV1]
MRITDEIVIRAPNRAALINFRELISYRGLLWSMSIRQTKAEFGELHLGIFWVLARPVLMTIIFVFFRNASNANTGVSITYSAYLYSGLILWFFFTESVSRASASISADAALMQKIYFPRLLSPLSSVVAQLSGLGITMVPLVGIMCFYRMIPGWNLLLLPVVLLQTLMLAFGSGCLFAALATLSRDWERLLSLLLYIGLFISPVIFAPSMLPKAAQSVQMLNPISGALLGFRASLFSEFSLPLYEWLYSVLISVLFAGVGVFAFQRAERTFMDRL